MVRSLSPRTEVVVNNGCSNDATKKGEMTSQYDVTEVNDDTVALD